MRTLIVALVLLVTTHVAAQSPTPAAPPAAAPSAAAASPAPTPPAQPTPPPQPAGFTYNAEGRRDPFISLLRRGAGSDMRAGGSNRPSGLAGLSVGEVAIKGTVASRGGFVAMLQGVDNRTYIVREGDRLLDGAVRSITQDTVVLSQEVNDPLSPDKQREVRKVLRQTEEAKQ